MERRQILAIGGVFLAAAAAAPALLSVPQARADATVVDDDDRFLGPAEAPVTIIEYSSLTCPHCASFHKDTLPQIKKLWIDAGRARLVFRHYPLDGLALRAAAVANCMQDQRHFGFLDVLFRSQQNWSRSQDPAAALSQLAKLAGMDQSTFDSCFSDEEEMDRILARARAGAEAFDVQSTPTLIVNGKKVVGAMTYEDFEKVLQEAAGPS